MSAILPCSRPPCSRDHSRVAQNPENLKIVIYIPFIKSEWRRVILPSWCFMSKIRMSIKCKCDLVKKFDKN